MHGKTATLSGAFVDVVETLAGDFDTAETLQILVDRSSEVLNVTAAGVMIANDQGELQVMASSSEGAQLLELYQMQGNEGPCHEAYSGGEEVQCPDLSAMDARWPRFAEAARYAGFSSVHAFPMRLRQDVIGGLNLFGSDATALDPAEDLPVARALADIAAIAVVHNRLLRDRETLANQLQTALNSRVVIEQAKGIVAAHLDVDLDHAFSILRSHARHNRHRLTDVATAVATGDVKAHDLLR